MLTVDKPAALLASMPDTVAVYGDRGGEDPVPPSDLIGFREKVILLGVLVVLAVATVYWIAFDG